MFVVFFFAGGLYSCFPAIYFLTYTLFPFPFSFDVSLTGSFPFCNHSFFGLPLYFFSLISLCLCFNVLLFNFFTPSYYTYFVILHSFCFTVPLILLLLILLLSYLPQLHLLSSSQLFFFSYSSFLHPSSP